MDILPPQEELKYKEKEFFQSLYEQVQSSSRLWFWLLLLVLLLAWPLSYFLVGQMTTALISKNPHLLLHEHPYVAEDLKVVRTEILPVARGIFSLVAQIVNPNATIAARRIAYHFVVRDPSGRELARQAGESYLLAGQSKFIIAPRLEIASGSPDQVLFQTDAVNWTILTPRTDLSLAILQQNAGLTPEGNFFVEGLIKNESGFGIRAVDVQALVFDRLSERLLAVNATRRDDLQPQESRYFRMLWPGKIENYGQIQISALVNLLDPGLVLENAEKIPVR